MTTTSTFQFEGKTVRGITAPLGAFSIVFASTDIGMVGCGAFDVMALDKFKYPAARVAGANGAAIATIDDLFEGIVKQANAAAAKRGVKAGMSGMDAIKLL